MDPYTFRRKLAELRRNLDDLERAADAAPDDDDAESERPRAVVVRVDWGWLSGSM